MSQLSSRHTVCPGPYPPVHTTRSSHRIARHAVTTCLLLYKIMLLWLPLQSLNPVVTLPPS